MTKVMGFVTSSDTSSGCVSCVAFSSNEGRAWTASSQAGWWLRPLRMTRTSRRRDIRIRVTRRSWGLNTLTSIDVWPSSRALRASSSCRAGAVADHSKSRNVGIGVTRPRPSARSVSHLLRGGTRAIGVTAAATSVLMPRLAGCAKSATSRCRMAVLIDASAHQRADRKRIGADRVRRSARNHEQARPNPIRVARFNQRRAAWNAAKDKGALGSAA